MSVDQYVLASAVVAALNRMADVEAQLARAAYDRGDEEGGAVHDHGEVCLREAARVMEALAGE